MVGMLVTFLVTFYLGCLHSILKEKKHSKYIYFNYLYDFSYIANGS